MLREETLQKVEKRTYEEPDGEFIEVLGQGSNTLSVLTRVDSDKVGGVDPPLDPEEYTVQALKAEIDGASYSDEQLDALLDAEKEGKDRTTATDAIKERLQ